MSLGPKPCLSILRELKLIGLGLSALLLVGPDLLELMFIGGGLVGKLLISAFSLLFSEKDGNGKGFDADFQA